jgi:hypothetical protein
VAPPSDVTVCFVLELLTQMILSPGLMGVLAGE